MVFALKTKICKKCNRELPVDVTHFHRQKLGLYGFRSTCKECRGGSFGVKMKNVVYSCSDGYKMCTKCDKELPADVLHFYGTNKTIDGFDTVCKVCKGASEYGVRHVNVVYDAKNGFKFCSVCRNQKKLSEFYKLQSNADGYMSRCMDCDAVTRKKYLSNPDANLKRKNYIKDYRKRYYATEKGRMVNAVNCQLRKSRKANVNHVFSATKWRQTLNYFDGKCAYCGKSECELTQEHFVPLSAGGEYTTGNIIPACSFCNSSKHNKSFWDWYPSQRFYSKAREKKIMKYLSYIDTGIQQLTITAICE